MKSWSPDLAFALRIGRKLRQDHFCAMNIIPIEKSNLYRSSDESASLFDHFDLLNSLTGTG